MAVRRQEATKATPVRQVARVAHSPRFITQAHNHPSNTQHAYSHLVFIDDVGLVLHVKTAVQALLLDPVTHVDVAQARRLCNNLAGGGLAWWWWWFEHM